MIRLFSLNRLLGGSVPDTSVPRCPMNRSGALRMLTAIGFGAVGTAGLAPLTSSAADGDMCSMMGGGTAASRNDMNVVMNLFRNHRKIHRTVEDVPNGIRATTESDDPHIASLLQAHVASMYQRVDQHRPFSMMSRTLPTLFRDAKRYKRHIAMMPKGIVVTETSTDPRLAEVIRSHGREVTGFVNDGMAAMMKDMMDGGTMGGGMVGGGMMHR